MEPDVLRTHSTRNTPKDTVGKANTNAVVAVAANYRNIIDVDDQGPFSSVVSFFFLFVPLSLSLGRS